MKKLFAIMCAGILCFASGCSKNNNSNSGGYAVVIQTESVTRDSANNTTTQNTGQTTQHTTAQTTNTTRATSATTSASTAAQGGTKGFVKKKDIDTPLDTRAVFTAGGSDLNGVLTFSAQGFTFLPDGGTPLEFPIDSVLLVVVSRGTDYELLGLLTANDQFQFKMDNGYGDKLSEYIIISEAQDIKSSGILLGSMW